MGITRDDLERMARTLARPPIATERLFQLDDGPLELRLERAWRDGATAFVFTPHEIIERLVAIVPRPRVHLTRYFGVLAPRFAAGSGIVPTKAAASAPAPHAPPTVRGRQAQTAGARPVGIADVAVFLNDILERGRCGGRMEIIAAVTSTEAVTRTLENLGLSSAPPAFHSARPPPQTEAAVRPRRVRSRPSGSQRIRTRPTGARRLRRLTRFPAWRLRAHGREREGGPVCPEADAVLVFPAGGGLHGKKGDCAD
jgi:hypothetical protein